MEQKWTVSGALGEWTLTVTLVPEDDCVLDESVAQRAMERFQSLDPHFYQMVNLTEALEFARR